MKANKVKQVLAQGGVAVGTLICEFSTSGIGRILASASADFAIFDMEHTAWSIETIRDLMATTRCADVVPIVRPPAIQYHMLSRPLDAGALGLMVPMVETEEQARMIVTSAKYAPEGRRGAAFGFPHDDYTEGDVIEKMTRANQEQLLVAQIETQDGAHNVDLIARVPGIDVLWIGQFDLTNSLGIPGQFTHPKFLRAVDAVVNACARHKKAAGFMTTSVEEGSALLARGFRCLAYSNDISVYRQALQQGLAALRKAAPISA